MTTSPTDTAPHGGDLHPPPPGAQPKTTWQRIRMIIKVIEVRLRFVAVLVIVGLVVGYWDTLKNYWDKWTRPSHPVAEAAEADTEYFCPMHPQVIRPSLDPGGVIPKCPICGMPLSIRKKGEPADAAAAGGPARVQLSPDRIRLAGVSTQEAVPMALKKELSAVGYVAYDQSKLSTITSRVSGYLDKLYVNQSFQRVDQSQALAEIYSPDMASAAQELVIALKSESLSSLVPIARQKLELLGLGTSEIDEIVRTREARDRLVIRSPQRGDVIRKNVQRGSHVESGAVLFELAEISTVWVETQVYEGDVPYVRQGQEVEATVDAFPGRVFRGVVSLVYPQVNEATRTSTVRFSVENDDHSLVPGMFVAVRLLTPLSEIEPYRTLYGNKGAETRSETDPTEGGILAVPESAVIDTGTKKIVYVAVSPDTFEARALELGPRVGAFYPVIRGLEPDARVVTSGSFLIDAETRLNPAAAATYSGAVGGPRKRQSAAIPGGAARPGQAADHATDANLAQLPPADLETAAAQESCPVTDLKLGSMGVPVKVTVLGKEVWICCGGCEAKLRGDPQTYLDKLSKQKK